MRTQKRHRVVAAFRRPGLGLGLALALIVGAPAASAGDSAGGPEREEPPPASELPQSNAGPVRGGPFSLVDHTGQRVTEQSFAGKFLLIYFGYTHCPDVCPTGLAVMSQAMELLGEAGANVQPLFITFDPRRDTVERLAEYLPNFHPRLIGLTGAPEETLAAATHYGVNVSETYAANQPGVAYSMNHSAFTYLMGPRGRLRMMFRDAITPQIMAASIERVLAKEARLGNAAEAPAHLPQSAPLTFTDHTGSPVSERDFQGLFQLVFLGYTHCPDVCPTGLQIMTTALRSLGESAERVQPIFVSIDPERDTPERLAQYVKQFHPRLIGLTGSPAQIAAAARAYQAVFVRVEAPDDPQNYTISHTDDIYLVGPQGEGLAIFEHGTRPAKIAREIRVQLERRAVASGDGAS